MTRLELHQTLAEMLAAFAPDAGPPGLRITGAEIDAPVEVTLAAGPDGLTAYAAPPVSRFATGFERPVHRMRITARWSAEPGGAP